jgi:hypothetical protein
MPGYVIKKLQEYKHSKPFKVQNCPYAPKPKKYGSEAQTPLPPNDSLKLNKLGIKRANFFFEESILRRSGGYDSFDGTQFHSCGTNKSNGKDKARCIQLLDYLSSQADAEVQNHSSDMIMNIHSNALYLSEANAQSRTCGHFLWDGCQRTVNPFN